MPPIWHTSVEGLERVRALKGIELMYGLGNKIVGSVPSAPRRFTF